jgi:NPCBM/NEW2 domain
MSRNDLERVPSEREHDRNTKLWVGAGGPIVAAIIAGIFLLVLHGGGNSSSQAESGGSASAKAGHSFASPTTPKPSTTSPVALTSQPAAAPSTGPPAGTPLTGPNAPAGIIVEYGNSYVMTDATGVSINGQTFADSFEGICESLCPNPETGTLPLDLGRKYTTLKAVFGVADNSLSSTDSATIEVIADGVIIYDHAFSVGYSENVSLNVSGVLRLTFQFSGDLEYVYPAVGEPTVYS